jgi:hypothetical protein
MIVSQKRVNFSPALSAANVDEYRSRSPKSIASSLMEYLSALDRREGPSA